MFLLKEPRSSFFTKLLEERKFVVKSSCSCFLSSTDSPVPIITTSPLYFRVYIQLKTRREKNVTREGERSGRNVQSMRMTI